MVTLEKEERNLYARRYGALYQKLKPSRLHVLGRRLQREGILEKDYYFPVELFMGLFNEKRDADPFAGNMLDVSMKMMRVTYTKRKPCKYSTTASHTGGFYLDMITPTRRIVVVTTGMRKAITALTAVKQIV